MPAWCVPDLVGNGIDLPMVTALYAAVSGLFLIFLSVRVIGQRRAQDVSVGHAGSPDLERAMRVQANFAEYTPLVLVLLALAELQGLPPWALHGLGLIFLAARMLHFLGFRSVDAPGRLRTLGMALTFGVIGTLSVLLPVQWLLSAS